MKRIAYVSTRGGGEAITAGEAILRGIAPDGGLYVPESFPVPCLPLVNYYTMPYQELAKNIFKLFLTDFTDDEIAACVAGAYEHNFTVPNVAPLVSAADAHFLELFHGPSHAFKDVALTILPRFMQTAARKLGLSKKLVVLVSTSGDTGKAALVGFSGVPGTKLFVLYPYGKVSKVQALQMTTQTGDNVGVLGVLGNFDDCQTTMKGVLLSPEANAALEAANAVFSSANSINIGRLLPQVVYYIFAYGQMIQKGEIKAGEPLNFTVPTGNFGNILAGYYARRLGFPIGTLICASNANNVLFDFIQTGTYDKNRKFFTTMSPSMDILVSSNLERLLYHLSGSPGKTKQLMAALSEKGRYDFDIPLGGFVGAYASEAETLDAIRRVCGRGYVMDTHTAVAYAAWEKIRGAVPGKNVIVSTASPFKFAADVLKGIAPELDTAGQDEFELLRKLSKLSGKPVPQSILDLQALPVLHDGFCAREDVPAAVLRFIEQ